MTHPFAASAICLLAFAAVPCCSTALAEPADSPPFPKFKMEEIDKSLSVGYAVLITDINGDAKPDVVVVDTNRVIWFANPSWKMRTIIKDKTKPDNVCIDAWDIDGDGQIDLALGADWKPFNTKDGGTLQWLKRGKTLDEEWSVYPIDTEPTVHRLRFADIDGTGKPRLIVGPLMGRNATKEKNWTDAPLRVLAYRIPKDPVKDRWEPEVLDESLHVMHNFQPVDLGGDGKLGILTASYEGVHWLARDKNDRWKRTLLGKGNQDTPKGSRGASEIKRGKLKNAALPKGMPFIATIEPWHGHEVVVYTSPDDGKGEWDRQVIDDALKWGHAVWCADLDDDGNDEIVVGVRDKHSARISYGVNVYRCRDAEGKKWEKDIIDNGGIAVEDLAVGDLNGDGRPDIVAVGRATGNVRIYWNQGMGRRP